MTQQPHHLEKPYLPLDSLPSYALRQPFSSTRLGGYIDAWMLQRVKKDQKESMYNNVGKIDHSVFSSRRIHYPERLSLFLNECRVQQVHNNTCMDGSAPIIIMSWYFWFNAERKQSQSGFFACLSQHGNNIYLYSTTVCCILNHARSARDHLFIYRCPLASTRNASSIASVIQKDLKHTTDKAFTI